MEFSLRRYPSGLSSLGIYLRFPHLFDLMCVEIADARMPSFHDLASCPRYKVHEELTVGGKPVVMDAADAST